MDRNSLLVVSDDDIINKNYSYALKCSGYKVDTAECGQSALGKIEEKEYDLCILDSSLPDVNTTFLCTLIRRSSMVPIIFLSSRYCEAELLENFEAGIDEYLVKPVSFRELAVRVKTLISRCQCRTYSKVIRAGLLTYNRDNDTVTLGGREIELTQTERKILKMLIDHIGEIVSSKDILKNV